MNSIQATLPKFTEALQENQTIRITPDDTWYRPSLVARIISIVLKTFGIGPDIDLEVAKGFAKCLRNWKLHVTAGQLIGIAAPGKEELEQIEKAAEKIKERLLTTIHAQKNALKNIRASIKQAIADGNEAEAVKLERDWESLYVKSEAYAAYRGIKEQILRFKYLEIPRSEHEAKVHDSATFEKNCSRIKTWVGEWQKTLYPASDFLQVEGTTEKIKRTAQFPEYVKLLKKNPLLREQFFKSVFSNMSAKNCDAVDAMIFTAPSREAFARTFMDKRLRYYQDDQGLKVHCAKIGNRPVYSLTVAVNGKQVPITNLDHVIQVADTTQRTVRTFFKELKEQNKRVIDYEYLQDQGICLTDLTLRKANLDKADWWKDIKRIEVRTREEISKEYGFNFSVGHGFMAIAATRESSDLNIQNTHGNLVVGIPLGDGTFNIIKPGKYAEWFPVGTIETLNHIYSTHLATLTLVDMSRSYNNREHAYIPIPLNEYRFNILMRVLAGDFKLSREGKLVFQAQGPENCAGWVQSVADRVFFDKQVPRFYEQKFIDCIAPAPVSYILKARALFPQGERGDKMWNTFRIGLAYGLGAWRKQEILHEDGSLKSYSLMNSDMWRQGRFHLPAKLFYSKKSYKENLNEYLTE